MYNIIHDLYSMYNRYNGYSRYSNKENPLEIPLKSKEDCLRSWCHRHSLRKSEGRWENCEGDSFGHLYHAVIGFGPRKEHRLHSSHVRFTSTTQPYRRDSAVIGCGPRKEHRPPLFPHALHTHNNASSREWRGKQHRPPSSPMHFTSTAQVCKHSTAEMGCGPRQGAQPHPNPPRNEQETAIKMTERQGHTPEFRRQPD